jgi:hypothetical protein
MQDLRSLATPSAVPPQVYRGLIGDDATGPNDQVTVRVPAYDASRSFGPCYVTPRPLRSGALLYPVRNDPCVVALDENEQAEILVWWANDPTADANAASRLTSLETSRTADEARLTTLETWYDSGWLADDNGTGGIRTYTHSLGLTVPPKQFRLWFSPDQSIWYPVAENRGMGTNEMSAATAANYHNPSLVRVSANTVEIAVYVPVAGGGTTSMPIYSGYTGAAWVNYSSGYWRYKIQR